VYTEVEEAISKYMMPGDIFIRYKDDSYVIVFAAAGPEEAQIKARLIAEEIKRRLFDHEEEVLKNINVEESVAVFATRDLKKGQNLSEIMDSISQNIEKKKNEPEDISPIEFRKNFEMPQPVEVDPYTHGP